MRLPEDALPGGNVDVPRGNAKKVEWVKEQGAGSTFTLFKVDPLCLIHPSKLLISGMLFALSACMSADELIDKVTVFDPNFAVVKTLASRVELTEFRSHWSQKKKLDKNSSVESRLQFTYKLDISASNKSARWLYQPDGQIVVLTKAKEPVFKIQEPEAFNKLIGATNSLTENRSLGEMK